MLKNQTFAFQDGIISSNSAMDFNSSTQYPPITVRDIPTNKNVNSTSSMSVARTGQRNNVGSTRSEAVSTTMTVKLNAMVDDLVGSGSLNEEEDEGDEEEEIIFRGKRRQVTPQVRSPTPTNIKDNETPKLSSSNSTSPPPPGAASHSPSSPLAMKDRRDHQTNKSATQNMKTLTARDMVNLVQNYTQTLSADPVSLGQNAVDEQFPNLARQQNRPSLSTPYPLGASSSMPDQPSSIYYPDNQTIRNYPQQHRTPLQNNPWMLDRGYLDTPTPGQRTPKT